MVRARGDAKRPVPRVMTCEVMARARPHGWNPPRGRPVGTERSMVEWTVTMIWGLAALVHLVPAAAVFSKARVEALYGVGVVSPELELLLRHRALLFGVVAALLLVAALRPELRPLAGALALVSMLGYVLLAWQVGTEQAALLRVLRVDLLVSLLLSAALVAECSGATGAAQRP